MTLKELRMYCVEKGINLDAIDVFKAEGAKNANQIFKMIEETQKVLRRIERVMDEAERMRNAYFFKSPNIASMRRSYEKQHSIDRFAWKDGKDDYEAEYCVTCSCRYVYARGYYVRNGIATNLKAIKASYIRLRKLIYAE